MSRLLILATILCFYAGQVSSQSVVALSAPSLAVTPFDYPPDPDYGVFVADRLTAGLMARSYSEALDRRRFVLVEPDTLPPRLTRLIASVEIRVPEDALEVLRKRTSADYLLTGIIDASGIRTVRTRLIDLATGRLLWSGEIRDDPSWTWSRANQNVGDISTEDIVAALGFRNTDSAPPPPDLIDLPSEIMVQPIYTTQWQYLAADCRIAIRAGMTRDGVFSLVPGELKGSGDVPLIRISKQNREQVFETTIAEAVLCGSIAVTGEAGTIHNLGLSLRLVDIASGRILWAHSASGRKVWRWDKLSDIIASMAGIQLEAIALFGASNAEDMVAELAEQAVDGPSFSELGEAYLSRGLVDRAEDSFKKAMDFGDAEAQAQNGLGQISIRKPEFFAKAIDHFKKAIKAEPDYLEPYSNLARAYLERDMSDGVRYARRAIEKDAAFALPYRVLGEYYARSEQDREAVKYLKPYVNLAPDDIETAVLLGRSFLRLMDYKGIEQAIGPIYRAKPDAIDLIPVMAVKDIRQRNYGPALGLFETYLLRVTELERKLFEDIRNVLPGHDVTGYERMSETAKGVYRDRFWREKDPDLTTELNERLLEHYGRVWFARRNFGDLAYPWDQRGAVYIRYGEPNYRSQSGRIPALTSPKVQQIKELMYADLYNVPPQGELVGPVFPIRSSRGITLAQREDFSNEAAGIDVDEDRTRSLSDPQSRAGGESYAPVTLFGDYSIVPWESWVYTEIGNGLVFDFTKEAGGSSGFDFAPLPDIPPSIMKSSARMTEYAPRLAYERIVSEVPDDFDEPEYAAIVGLKHETFDFRAEAFKTRLDVSYGIPEASVRTHTRRGQETAVLVRSIALADSAYARVFRRMDRVELQAVDGEFVDLIRADLEPGTYHLSLRIHDTLGGRLTTVEQDVVVEGYPAEALGLSDIVLAQSIEEYSGEIRFRRGKWQVRPKPGGSYQKTIMPFYYEIYGISKNTFGQTRYQVTAGVRYKKGLRRRPAFLGEAKPEVSFTFEQSGDQDWERGQLELDLTQAKYGTNSLTLTVVDLESGKSVQKEVDFDYLKPNE